MIMNKYLAMIVCICCLSVLPMAEAAVSPLSMSGTVELKFSGEKDWQPLLDSMELQVGDQIRTGDTGLVELLCDYDGSTLTLRPNTQLRFEQFQFSETDALRVFRLYLLRGTLEASVVELDFTRYHLNKQALIRLKDQGLPLDIWTGLAPLENQKFADEEMFLEAVKQQIGGEQMVRYKLLLLEHTNTKHEVFDIITKNVVVGTNTYFSALTITFNQQAIHTDVVVQQGRFSMRRIHDEGTVRASGVVDNHREGVAFALPSGLARVHVEECDILVESSAPIADSLALIGDIDSIVGIRNGEDSPKFTVYHDEDSSTELAEDEEAMFGIPADHQLQMEFPDVVNTTFGFCKQLSSFVFVTRGCPTINGQENCCGELSLDELPPSDFVGERDPTVEERREEDRIIPPASLQAAPEGGVGSPVLP